VQRVIPFVAFRSPSTSISAFFRTCEQLAQRLLDNLARCGDPMAERQPRTDTVSVQRRNDLPRIMASGMPSGSSTSPLDVPTPFLLP